MLLSAVLTLGLVVPAPSSIEARVIMGTVAKLEAWGLEAPNSAFDAAFAAIARVEDRVSLWKETELARLNRDGRSVASDDLLTIIRSALDIAAATDGAFDPSVEPLLRAQGFYDGVPRSVGDAERRSILARIGHQRVRVEGQQVRLGPGMALDLSGIAKGYAADQALLALRQAKATAAVVDLGGSSICASGKALEVEVRGGLGRFVLEDACLGTSGSDQRTGHILDPRTGLAAQGTVLATVIAPSGLEADGLDTALYVLGEPGLRVLTARGLEGFIVKKSGDGFELVATPGFARKRRLVLGKGVTAR